MDGIVKKLKETAWGHRRAICIVCVIIAGAAAAIWCLSFIGKIRGIYPSLRSFLWWATALGLLLYAMTQAPVLKKPYRIMKYTLIVLASTAVFAFVFMIVWYAFFFFPDDGDYLKEITSKLTRVEGGAERVELDLVRGIGSAAAVNPLSADDRAYLFADGLAEKDFYLDRNPYDRTGHPSVVKYATGKIFYYTSQKTSLALKKGSRFEFTLGAGSGRFLELDAAFPSLDGNQGPARLKVSYRGAKNQVLAEKLLSRERKPDIKPFRYSNVLSSISFYLRHPGRTVLIDNTGWERVRVPVPDGPGRLIIEADMPSGPSYLFLGSPRVMSRAAGKRSDYLNIAYIIFDCMAKNHIELYEYPELFKDHGPEEAMRIIGPRNTIVPSLNRYAREAILFDSMYSVGQVTRPSIVSLWNSRPYTESRLPVFRNIVTRENREEYNALGFAALGDELSSRGWFTKQISCNAQGHGVSSVGVDLGFDENYDYTMETSEHPENIRRIVEFFQENRNRKFFLYSHINTPHSPSWIPLGYYLKALWDTDFIFSSAKVLGNVRYLNSQIERILEAAEKLGLRKNTLFIFTADHSFGRSYLFRTIVTEEEMMWGRRDSQQVAWFHGKAIYVRKGGPDLFRSTMNIPFVVIPPKNAGMEPGKIKAAISTLDVAPTLLDLTVGASQGKFTGRSFKGLLFGREDREKVFSPFIPMVGRFQRAFLLEGRYKYWLNLPGLYRYRDSGGKKYIMQQEYLYDYEKDPWEAENLALDGRAPGLLARMRKIYRERFIDYPDRNYIQIAPRGKGQSGNYRIVVDARGRILHTHTYLDTIDIIKEGPSRVIFNATIKEKPGIVSFETDPPAATVSMTFYRDGVLLARGDILTSPEKIAIFGNPLRLERADDFYITRDPAKTGLEAVDLPPGSVYFSRVPLNYWMEMGGGEKDIKLSPGIKEVLRGWGYIQ